MQLKDKEIGLNQPLLFMIGPCAIESYDMAMRIGEVVSKISAVNDNMFIFKGSFDKANRTSVNSFRGVGMEEGLRILSEVRAEFSLPIMTDVHLPDQVGTVSEVVDCLQIPALLCRQTDLVEACARSGKPTNIKKAQFLSPMEMVFVVEKARSVALKSGNNSDNFMICERGTSFGYGDLVVDMRSLQTMRNTSCPIIFDASHSAQSGRSASGEVEGCRDWTPLLARAAVAAGVSGIFLETHPVPERARSDSSTQFPLACLQKLISNLIAIDGIVKPDIA